MPDAVSPPPVPDVPARPRTTPVRPQPENLAADRRSDRVRLAQLARAVALGTPGVLAADRGPAGLVVTSGGGEQVDGVTCVAAADGSYEVTLRLVCDLVPLRPLGVSVRAAVESAAAAAGLPVRSVDIFIAAVGPAGGG